MHRFKALLISAAIAMASLNVFPAMATSSVENALDRWIAAVVSGDQTRVEADDQTLTHRAPRLTIFRQIEGKWKVSAHANFALPKEE